ncbi:hypothetical protein F5B17DRAFT_439603 [Nemania serpens]|nr:hypothetical protein F5B17DRAFT_439603 [Nemania serpens]
MLKRAISAEGDGDGDGDVEGSEKPRTYLLRWTADGDASRESISDAAQLLAWAREREEEKGKYRRQLFIFHGLPVAYGVALRESVGVDAEFIAAHAGRRRYRPSTRKTGALAAAAIWAHFDYPELFSSHRSASASASTFDGEPRRNGDGDGDLLGDAPAYETSATAAGEGVVFCRASIWISKKGNVLFLDRGAWENASAGRVGLYRAYDTAEKMPDANGVSVVSVGIDAEGRQTVLGDEMPSFETLLVDGLWDGCGGSGAGAEDLVELIEEIAVRKWDEFFEALGLDLTVGEEEEEKEGGNRKRIAALFTQMLGCLERNLGVSRLRMQQEIRRRSGDTLSDVMAGSMTAEWDALLSRLDRRAQLLRHLKPVVAVPTRRSSAETEPSTGQGLGISSSGAETLGDGRSHRRRESACTCNADTTATTTTKSAREESQRSLNRVAYLGGVLLPFSVVSGILAIEDPFGPGNGQFWIFWAVTVPLVLATLGIIYADSIRKAEVWVEVVAGTTAAANTNNYNNNNNNDNDDIRYAEPVKLPTPDVEQAVPVSRIFRPISVTPGHEGRLAFSGDLRGRMREREEAEEEAEGEGEGEGTQGEQGTFVEKLWPTHAPRGVGSGPASRRTRREGKKTWRKEELGWMGAFATMFRVYKLKKSVRPDVRRRGGRGMF